MKTAAHRRRQGIQGNFAFYAVCCIILFSICAGEPARFPFFTCQTMTTKPPKTSPDNDLALLKQRFPQCFDKSGDFDFDKFKKHLSRRSGLKFSTESYGMDWLGKSYARLLACDDPTTLLQEDTAWNSRPENQGSENLLIRGDNLEALKHLSHAYREKIKMIYIDPPYNTGSDGFVYQDDRKFTAAELQALAGVDEYQAERILDFVDSKSNSHSAWLTFMYPRLYVAKQLLREDGVILVQIDHNESHALKLMMDDVFGEENFKEEIIWEYRTGGMPVKTNCFGKKHDTIFGYSKQPDKYSFNNKAIQEKIYYEKDFFGCRKDADGNFYVTVNIRDVIGGDIKVQEGKTERILSVKPLINMSKERLDGFDSQKPSGLIKFLSKFYIDRDKSQIALDFFAGSGTTGDAVMQLNAEDGGCRRYILVQIPDAVDQKKNAALYNFVKNKPEGEPRTIFDITKERLKRAAQKLQAEHADKSLDLGFKVFQTVPRWEGFDIKAETFDETQQLFNERPLSEEDIQTLLTTWKTYDGIPLTHALQRVDLAGYTGYYYAEKSAGIRPLYLLHSGFETRHLLALLEKVDSSKTFNPASIIVFGHHFSSKMLRGASEAVTSYANRKETDIDFIIRCKP